MGFSDLELAEQERLDALCLEFEDRWLAAPHPSIADMLARAPEPLAPVLLSELIRVDLAYRRQRGESPVVEDYLRHAPQLRRTIAAAFGHRCNRPPASAADAPLVADQLVGRYCVLRKLGAGGFGDVWLARDEDLARDVAIKISRRPCDDQRLLEEARMAARIRHEGVVAVHDAGQLPDGRLYVVFEHVDGATLRQQLQDGPCSPRQAARWISEAAKAVHAAHLKGVFHRDINADNVLIDREGHARVTDFGLALHELKQPQSAGEVAGSQGYMAPEQIRGEAHWLDGRADIWALGVLLYELLAGRRPFAGDTASVSQQILHRPPRPLRQLRPGVPRHLERICLKCLAKEPAQRPATAADVARLLDGSSRRAWLAAAAVMIMSASLAAGALRPAAAVQLQLLAWRDIWQPLDAQGTLRQDDLVAVRVDANRRRRLYVWWIDNTGDCQLLTRQPAQAAFCRLPADDNQGWPMRKGSHGLETVVALAAPRPLPVELARRLLDELPSPPNTPATRLVQFSNGLPLAPMIRRRSPDTASPRQTDARLQSWHESIWNKLREHGAVASLSVYCQ